MARSAYYPFWLVYTFVGKKVLILILQTCALVTFWLDYCKALYVGLSFKLSWKLQLVQNAEAHLLPGAICFCHITSLLREFNWLPIAFRAQFKMQFFI